MTFGEHTLRAAKDERELERMLTAIEQADLEEALRLPWGRRLLSRIIFNVAGLESRSFDPAIKDGICAARHDARNEGMREVGLVLATQCALRFPDMWTQLNIERWSAAAEEARLREVARAEEARRRNASMQGDEP